jgi:hypothetical protein
MNTMKQVRVDVIGDEIVLESPIEITTGDTVSYFNPQGGKVRVEFELPFTDAKVVVEHGQELLFGRPGKFFGKCFVTFDDGRPNAAWSVDKPKAGGEHDVKP